MPRPSLRRWRDTALAIDPPQPAALKAAVWAVLVLATLRPVPPGYGANMPIPILLDTDIGTDIDDIYALILAARSPELDLRAVTTVNNDTELRAKIAKKVLQLLGRDHVPVAVGEGRSLTP